jgi:glycosyltransferase involved in cell wall biosynthesis
MPDDLDRAPKKTKVSPELVSFVIPAYNASLTIDDCIHSICNIVYRPLEIAVYNDASTDDTLKKLKAWIPRCADRDIVLHIVEQKKNTAGGAGYAKNRAAEVCSGTYLAFLDSDDMVLPHRVDVQL